MSYTGGLNAFGLHQYDYAASFFGEGNILPQARARSPIEDATEMSVRAFCACEAANDGFAVLLML